MKKTSKISSAKSKKSPPNVSWFGIRITYIALPVAVVCLMVGGLLINRGLSDPQQYVLGTHDEVTSGGMSNFGDAHDPVGGTDSMPSTITHCIPRPSCLDGTPKCLIAEPAGGWCQISGTPELTRSEDKPEMTPVPQGCFASRQCTTISCPAGVDADECYACKKTLVCPHEMGMPAVTCTPRPICKPGQECQSVSSEDTVHWCPLAEVSSAPSQNSSVSGSPEAEPKSISSWLNNLLHNFFH